MRKVKLFEPFRRKDRSGLYGKIGIVLAIMITQYMTKDHIRHGINSLFGGQ